MKLRNRGVWMATGVGIGTALGVALKNIAIGVSLGVAIGSLIDYFSERDSRCN